MGERIDAVSLVMVRENRIKLIASDLDGTLLQNGRTTVSDEMLRMIPMLKERGISFCAASGRSYGNLRLLFAPVRDEISYLCDNGSVVYHKGRPVYENTLEKEMCALVLKKAALLDDCEAFVACAEGVFTDSDQEEFWQFMRRNSYGMMEKVPDLTQFQRPLYKIALYSRQHAPQLAAFFQEFCQGRIYALQTSEVWVDFINPDATKGDALKALGRILSIGPEETMAFGDRFNDVQMLEYAGCSYAMESGEEGLAAHASAVTPTVEEIVRQLLSPDSIR